MVFCGPVCINSDSSRHDYGLKTTLRDPKNVGGKLEVPGIFLFDSADVLKLVCFLLSNFFDFVHFTMASVRCLQNVNNVRLTQQSALKQLKVIRKHACTISKKVDFYFQLCHDAQNWLRHTLILVQLAYIQSMRIFKLDSHFCKEFYGTIFWNVVRHVLNLSESDICTRTVT